MPLSLPKPHPAMSRFPRTLSLIVMSAFRIESASYVKREVISGPFPFLYATAVYRKPRGHLSCCVVLLMASIRYAKNCER